jgi:23S rRNA pseudouridine955/2504/2580 synthase
MIELIAAKDDAGRRLDRILRKALPDLSLSLIHRLLRQKKILVDNKPVILPNHRIEQGMVIKINAPVTYTSNQVNDNNVNHNKIKVNKKKSTHANLKPRTPNPEPLILWQGSGIIVLNKPQGLSTHGPHSLDSIVNAWLSNEVGDPLPHSLSFKPGPLHRLDKPTSGAIVFSQTLEGAKLFSALLRERKLEKSYIAIVEGRIKKDRAWHDVLAHDKDVHKTFVNPEPQAPNPVPLLKEAVTTIKTLASNNEYSLIEASIKTGRHHQIRAQAASHGHPLAGDIKYGAKPLPGQSCGGGFFLHAWKIMFNENPDGFPREIIAPLPEEFQARIEKMFKR